MADPKQYGAMGWALQLFGYIMAGVILGRIIDHFTHNEKGLFTLACIVLSFISFVIILLRGLKK
jgi:F0F1-type ATP synthase assembly protein I